MSVEAIAWALRVPIGGNAKVILLGLANHASAEMEEARPSVDTLAIYAHCDRRTVQRNLRQLEEAGWIVRTGWHALHDRPDRAVAVWALAGRQNVTPLPERGGTSTHNGATPAPPEPSLEPSRVSITTQEGSERPALHLLSATEQECVARKAWTHGRHRVSAEEDAAGERLLATWNDATGQRLQARKRDGRPSDHLRQIVGAVIGREGEASEEDWHRAIRNTAANPPSWIDGRLILGHVFGARAADHALVNTGVVPIAAAAGGRGPSRFQQAQASLAALHAQQLAEESVA
jgi:hypothetical protein